MASMAAASISPRASGPFPGGAPQRVHPSAAPKGFSRWCPEPHRCRAVGSSREERLRPRPDKVRAAAGMCSGGPAGSLGAAAGERPRRRGGRLVARSMEEASEAAGQGGGQGGGSGGLGGSAAPRARMSAARVEEFELEEMERPLAEYMSLPASQYSVLDAERIERVDDTTFKCYVHTLKFFAFKVCPVLLVRVEERPNGCCIRLLSCTLEGSPIVAAQNSKFSAEMMNQVSWSPSQTSPTGRLLISDTTIQVTVEIPPAFRIISKDAVEATGNRVLGQVLRLMVPRFLQQLGKDYKAWASGDQSRRPVGTGQL